jgi:hypothetical protein
MKKTNQIKIKYIQLDEIVINYNQILPSHIFFYYIQFSNKIVIESQSSIMLL